ncbi:MAG: DNA mismatch repair endonuclease MutL [Pseudomonadota bacterium]
MSIHILPPEVVDQIAAGEVVERPAHLIKELVENSLDAGATEIEIEYDDGGKSVRVTDNGSGIEKSQLTLALARHATSKIESSEDLWRLKSYGFRGEALASIASVSQFAMTSRPQGADQAYKLVSEFGVINEPTPSGGERGTQIQIRDLFQNVPARLKFLKSDAAEGTQIKNALKALALAYPAVSFRIRTKGKLLFYWPGQDSLETRASQILDKEPLYSNTYELEGMKAQVSLAAPNETTGNAKQIWLFVQGRWVQDRSLQTAVMDGFRSLLMHGEFPYAAVWLECPPDAIDINIHPTKSQVKFLDSRSAFRVVQRAVRGVLETAPWISDAFASEEEVAKGFSSEGSQGPKLQDLQAQPENLSFAGSELDRVQLQKKADMFSASREHNLEMTENDKRKFKEDSELDRFFGSTEIESGIKMTVAVPESQYVAISKKSEEEVGNMPDTRGWSSLHILGQAHETYILAQNEKSLFLIDQHAAHERVAYESLMNRWQSGDIDVQSYLIPLTIDLDAENVEALLSVKDEVERLGVSIEQLGPEAIGVTAAPSILNESAIAKSLAELSRSVLEFGGGYSLEKSVSHVCATMACHSVIRAGQAMSESEMMALLKSMDQFPMSSFCPHGRPVYIEYPFSKVERDFGRIV